MSWLLFVGAYPLKSINARLVQLIGACYSQKGIIDEKLAVYSPYSTKTESPCTDKQVTENTTEAEEKLEQLSELFNGTCARFHQADMVLRYGCGADFLPSPLASKAEFALTAEPSLERNGYMTAVAVAVEMGHAVAFLGTANGEVTRI